MQVSECLCVKECCLCLGYGSLSKGCFYILRMISIDDFTTSYIYYKLLPTTTYSPYSYLLRNIHPYRLPSQRGKITLK